MDEIFDGKLHQLLITLSVCVKDVEINISLVSGEYLNEKFIICFEIMSVQLI